MNTRKILVFANQKGGCGKTTTTVNVGAGLAAEGYRVLLIDLDPQGNLSSYIGFEKDDKPTIGDLMHCAVNNQPFSIPECIRTSPEGMDYIPSAINLASADYFLTSAMSREMVLDRILKREDLPEYDYILIDTLPSLGILLINALACADSVIVPVQAQKFALDGLQDFMNVFSQIKANLNERLRLEGIVLTMAENTNMSGAVRDSLRANYKDYFFQTEIRRSVEATMSTYYKKSLIQTKRSRLGDQYRDLVSEILHKNGDAE